MLILHTNPFDLLVSSPAQSLCLHQQESRCLFIKISDFAGKFYSLWLLISFSTLQLVLYCSISNCCFEIVGESIEYGYTLYIHNIYIEGESGRIGTIKIRNCFCTFCFGFLTSILFVYLTNESGWGGRWQGSMRVHLMRQELPGSRCIVATIDCKFARRT